MLIRKLIELLNLTPFPFINFDFYLVCLFRTTMNNLITHQPTQKVHEPDSYEKGRLFEEFIIKLFNERHFKLAKWRKAAKSIDRSFLNDSSNPDLELIFTGSRKYHFAVECKWRKEFVEGKISWATDYQICSYDCFENCRRMPVFIAIGIGGDPWNPEKLFVTPLCNINMYTEVYESDLIPYKRKPTNRFFYDTVQLRLW